MITTVDEVLIDQRCPHGRVPHAVHQLARGGAARRGEGVAGVPEIVEVDVTQAGRGERAEPDPPEVVPAQDTTARPDEDEPGSAGIGVLGQEMRQLLGEGGREGDGSCGHGVI